MNKFKNGEIVHIIDGEQKGLSGKVVDNEGPITWVELTLSKEVVNVHEDHMQKSSEMRE